MHRWEIRVRDRLAHKDAPNWLVALGLIVEEFNLDAESLSRMVCDLRDDGTLWIREPVEGITIVLRKLAAPVRRPAGQAPAWANEGEFEDIFDADSSASEAQQGPARYTLADTMTDEAEATPPTEDEDAFWDDWGGSDEPDKPKPPPTPLAMPALGLSTRDAMDEVAALFDQAPSEDDTTRIPATMRLVLLERGMEIASAVRASDAADLALTVLRQVVAAEAGAVLVQRDGALVFLAAQGPHAANIKGLTIPLGTGIPGHAIKHGNALIVHNVSADIRHAPELDAKTGYRTRSVLVVPLRDGQDVVLGGIELLNPPRRFQAWHLEAARTVAVALAQALRRSRSDGPGEPRGG